MNQGFIFALFFSWKYKCPVFLATTALYLQNLPKPRYFVNLRTTWEAMGNANKNFLVLKGAPYMVYLYSYVKLFDDIRTSRYDSQKRCHVTSRKLQTVYCAQCCLLSKIKAILGHFVITCWNVIIFLLRTFLETFLNNKISLSHWALTVHAYQWETLSSFFSS